ncbi:hypothetical protein QBC39DRAFT_264278 [Podospora conica]|nr:hypothetical protein QBC39DRAFT_264278 [Schizothecium conicum]
MSGLGVFDATSGEGIDSGQIQTGRSEFRPRRSHTKSRNGCTQCRRRRIKCDELRPKCTRCQKGDLTCKYPGTQDSRDVPPHHQHFELDIGPVRPCVEFEAPVHLSAEDAELYRHYVQHSGACIDFGDGGDVLALQVGVPGLAAVCPGLLSSVLALAAACSCCDIMSHPALVPGDHGRVASLLSTADRHHLASLQKIRETIANKANRCEQTLANALLMAIYGTSTQRARVWLMDAAESGEHEFELPRQLLPTQPGWISLVHSFQKAHAIILGMPQQETAGIWPKLTATWQNGTAAAQDDMAEPTLLEMNALHGTLVVAFRPALAKLKRNVRALVQGEMTSAEVGACQQALDLLDDVALRVLSPKPLRSSTGSQSAQGEFGAVDPASHVSSWLRCYSDQVLGFAPPRHESTAIIGFLCQAPPSFLGLVETALATMPRGLSSGGNMGVQECGQSIEMSPAAACAINIFAHWLALSMLLEDVWWFGEIGEWELEKIVMAVRSGRVPLAHQRGFEGDWLPERILRIHEIMNAE